MLSDDSFHKILGICVRLSRKLLQFNIFFPVIDNMNSVKNEGVTMEMAKNILFIERTNDRRQKSSLIIMEPIS